MRALTFGVSTTSSRTVVAMFPPVCAARSTCTAPHPPPLQAWQRVPHTHSHHTDNTCDRRAHAAAAGRTKQGHDDAPCCDRQSDSDAAHPLGSVLASSARDLGWDGSGQGRTVTLPGFMEAIISLVMSSGAFLPGISAVVMMMSTFLHCFANRSCARDSQSQPSPPKTARLLQQLSAFVTADVGAALSYSMGINASATEIQG